MGVFTFMFDLELEGKFDFAFALDSPSVYAKLKGAVVVVRACSLICEVNSRLRSDSRRFFWGLASPNYRSSAPVDT